MTLNPLTYLYGGVVLAALLGAMWVAGDVHGHKVGKAAGDKEVSALQLQYSQATQKAVQMAADAQKRADAASLAQATALQANAEKAAQKAAQTATESHAKTLALESRIKELSTHDAKTAAWLSVPVPTVISGLH